MRAPEASGVVRNGNAAARLLVTSQMPPSRVHAQMSTAHRPMSTDLTPLEPDPSDIQPFSGLDAIEQVLSDWVQRAADDFSSIHRTKQQFFQDVFTDAPWQDLPFSDESRRYSRFVAMVFARASEVASVRYPSQTEVNDWFHFFARSERLAAANVPGHLLPTSRGVSNALASAVIAVADPKQKLNAEKAILLKLEEESKRNEAAGGNGIPVTAQAVKLMAAQLGYRKPTIEKPTEHRELTDLDAATWNTLVGLAAQLYTVPRSQLAPEKERQQMLKLTATLRDLTLRPVHFVFGCFDEHERFDGLVLAAQKEFEAYLKQSNVQMNRSQSGFVVKSSTPVEGVSTVDTLISEGDLAPGETSWTTVATATLAWSGGRRFTECRLVLFEVADEREAMKIADRLSTTHQRMVQPIPMKMYARWRDSSFGQIPLGTVLDEVLEPGDPAFNALVAAEDGVVVPIPAGDTIDVELTES
jgi:hypothetical protein